MTSQPPAPVPGAAITPRPARAHAPGKINLSLRAGGPDAAGYHGLVTIFQAISLTETVTLQPAEAPSLRLTEPHDGVPLDERNLAWRAVEAVCATLRDRDLQPTGHFAIEISKQVPVAGGMAGGSADAAAALVAANHAWGGHLDHAGLQAIARTLGADVPFALHGGVALGTGRGDHLRALPATGTWHWAVARQDVGLSTPEVFAAFDELGGATAPNPEPGQPEAVLAAALESGDPYQLGPHLHNDLAEAALELFPALHETTAALERAGALAVVVSGSGPTIAALCLDQQHAQSVARVAAQASVAADILTVSGPAPGARLDSAY